MPNEAPHILKTRFARYAVAVAAVILATAVRAQLAGELGTRMPFVTYYVAVIFIAWYGRLGPTLLTIALSTPVAAYLFMPPVHSLLITESADLFGLAFFILLGVSNAVLSEALHRTALRAEDMAARHMRAEEAASFLAAIVESSEDAIFGKTLDGTIVSWNAGAERIYGYSPDEIKGRPVSVLAPTDRVDEIPAILDKLRRGEHIHQLETVRVRKDGAHINVALTISPIRDSRGNVTGASTTARDITDHKRFEAERALLLAQVKEQRSRLNNIIANVPGVVWEAWGRPDEAAQRINYVSDYVETMLGYSRDEWLSIPNFWLQVVHPEDKERAASEAHAIYESCVGGISRFRWIARDGRVIWVEAQSAIVCDGDGNPVGMRGVTMDITERKRAEEAERFLAEASKLLSSSLDYVATLANLADLIVPRLADWCAVHVLSEGGQTRQIAVTHADPKKVEWARELERNYPYDPDAAAGVANVLRTGGSEFYADIPDEMLVASARDEQHLKVIRELGVRSAVVVPMIARGRTLGAITMAMAESNRRYENADLKLAENLAGRAALAVDNTRLYGEAQLAISEREEALRLRDEFLKREQAAREQAEAANRMKDEFLATVSHELRTPLNAILGWAHMLRNSKFDQEVQSRALETIERNARSQAQLIEDILDVSRIITGKLRLDTHPVELLPVIEAAVDVMRPAAAAKEISITSALDPRAGPVTGDPNRLQQVVWNLVSNAVKFTPRGGSVEVRLERAGSHAEITVSDTGQGISREFLPHVFDRFRQADPSSTRRHGGLGLGLAIVRHLVEMHGGTVDAESAGEGLGATFTVSLPLLGAKPERPDAARAHTAGQAVALASPSANLNGIAVMVVDDERDTREMLKIMVEKFGATARAFASSDEAIAALGDWKPDVIISDIEMPDEDGYSFIGRVRKLEAATGAHTPAVALTAYARAEDRLRALSAGYHMHIAKPVDPSELVMAISNLASRGGRGRSM